MAPKVITKNQSSKESKTFQNKISPPVLTQKNLRAGGPDV